MSGRVIICCGALFLVLTSVSAVQRLNSIHDLKKINFGRSVPEHSLVLLYWFAHSVVINTNNNIRLTFDPNNGHYGSHHYGNYEQLLDPLPQGHQYYTVGNLNQDSPMELPSYVVNHRMVDTGRNRARIIISMRGPNTGRHEQWIDRVYITQHYETSGYGGTRYDPQHTYEISTNLLREIREFSVGDDQRLLNRYARNTNDFQLNDIRNTWGNLAGLELLLFIVIQKKYSSKQHNRQSAARNTQPDFVVNFPENSNNHRDANASVTCECVISILFILLVLLFIFYFYIFPVR